MASANVENSATCRKFFWFVGKTVPVRVGMKITKITLVKNQFKLYEIVFNFLIIIILKSQRSLFRYVYLVTSDGTANRMTDYAELRFFLIKTTGTSKK